jgi:hypothetical protein
MGCLSKRINCVASQTRLADPSIAVQQHMLSWSLQDLVQILNLFLATYKKAALYGRVPWTENLTIVRW